MQVFIPTLGRIANQLTWDGLPPSVRAVTQLVCPEREALAHRARGRNVMPCPDEIKGIGATRQWIMENATARVVVMSDDDHVFYKRSRDTDDTKLTACGPADMEHLFSLFPLLVPQHFHQVGLSPRALNNNKQLPCELGGRQFNFYAMDREKFRELNLSFAQAELMEDFTVLFGFYAAGCPNILVTNYCWNQSASNAPGGCSGYRNAAMQERAAKALGGKWPDYVDVIKKSAKWGSGMAAERFDVKLKCKAMLKAVLGKPAVVELERKIQSNEFTNLFWK